MSEGENDGRPEDVTPNMEKRVVIGSDVVQAARKSWQENHPDYDPDARPVAPVPNPLTAAASEVRPVAPRPYDPNDAARQIDVRALQEEARRKAVTLNTATKATSDVNNGSRLFQRIKGWFKR